jgi:ankyrin repeat protein
MIRTMYRTPKASFCVCLILVGIAAFGWLYFQQKVPPEPEIDLRQTLDQIMHRGASERSEILIREHPQPNWVDPPRRRFPNDPFLAAEFGDLESVKKFVEKDPKIVRKTDGNVGYTMLHKAAWGNQPEVIRYLVGNGAKVDELTADGDYSPLFLAAQSDNSHAVKSGRLLIELGAEPTFRMGEKASGSSVLDEAAMCGHAELVKLLLKKGISPFTSAKNSYGDEYWRYTSFHKACEGPIASGYLRDPATASDYADNHKVIELLLPIVKDVNTRDIFGRTALHFAAMYAQSNIADYLLTKYSKVDINARDKDGNTPTHLAVKGVWGRSMHWAQPMLYLDDRVATVKALLKHKPDLTIKNSRGQTPADRARGSGYKEIMALFR